MCGIFGIRYFDSSRKVALEMVRQATDTMIHRGPDDAGYFAENNVGLGHRRLSIIDLSSGHQPMTNETGDILVVYNGEIYNYKEIKITLVKLGHSFKTDCDTEVIVHAYEEWGYDSVNKFIGMFAFIVFDKQKNSFWVVRDRLGIKPLYFYHDNEVFIAASEVMAILETGHLKSSMNDGVLDSYLSLGYVPGSETMFKNIHKVLPGHYLEIKPGGSFKVTEYWDFASFETEETNAVDAIERFDELLTDCVQKRLISDVPLGAFLSGGLDSSLVVGMMDKIQHNPVSTFTVAYHEGFSEERYASLVADKFNTDHHVFYLDSSEFLSSIETLISYSEEPIVEPAAIALYHISKKAREHATVLLSGEGSDEVFAGYALYQIMSRIESFQKKVPSSLLPLVSSLRLFSRRNKYKKLSDWLRTPLQKRYQGTSSYLTPSIKKSLYSPDFLNNHSPYLNNRFQQLFDKVKHRDDIDQMLYVDTKTWLVDDLLVKADKMTMAASIELRVPFMDHRLIEAAASLPSRLKIKGGEGKYLVKKIAENYLPDDIIYRNKKGFPVPTENWFQGELLGHLEDTLGGLKQEGWFQPKALDSLLDNHKKGVEDNSKLLMSLMVLSEWRRQFA